MVTNTNMIFILVMSISETNGVDTDGDTSKREKRNMSGKWYYSTFSGSLKL